MSAAALPMYARPETEAAQARLWAAMREYGWDGVEDAPTKLGAPGDLWVFWASTDLIFGQTCGLPYRLMDDRPALLGAPTHPLDLTPGTYQSVIVTRQGDARRIEDLSHAPIAINEPRSQSGWAAAWDAGLGRGAVRATGSHRASAQAVADRQSDVATIDIVTWEMLKRWEPSLTEALQEVDRTREYPALPFITRIADVTGLRDALRHGVATLSDDDKDTLLLSGISDVREEDYLALPNPPTPHI